MNPFPYYFFGIIFLVWLIGFVIKRSTEDDREKINNAIRNAMAEKLGVDTKAIIESVKRPKELRHGEDKPSDHKPNL